MRIQGIRLFLFCVFMLAAFRELAIAADQFGFDVEISGDQALVAAPCHTWYCPPEKLGLIYVFERQTSSKGSLTKWNLITTFKAPLIYPKITNAGSGKFLISGALGSQGFKAFLISRQLSGTTSVWKMEPLVSKELAGFPFKWEKKMSVSADESTIALGFPEEPHSIFAGRGAVYLFRRDARSPGHWVQTAKLLPPNVRQVSGPHDNIYFGDSLDVSEGKIVVQASEYPFPGEGRRGAVFSFTFVNGSWANGGQIIPTNLPEGRHGLGEHLSMVGRLLAFSSTDGKSIFNHVFSYGSGMWRDVSRYFTSTASIQRYLPQYRVMASLKPDYESIIPVEDRVRSFSYDKERWIFGVPGEPPPYNGAEPDFGEVYIFKGQTLEQILKGPSFFVYPYEIGA